MPHCDQVMAGLAQIGTGLADQAAMQPAATLQAKMFGFLGSSRDEVAAWRLFYLDASRAGWCLLLAMRPAARFSGHAARSPACRAAGGVSGTLSPGRLL